MLWLLAVTRSRSVRALSTFPILSDSIMKKAIQDIQTNKKKIFNYDMVKTKRKK